MSTTSHEPGMEPTKISMLRRVSGTPEQVFDAWLCSDQLPKWWGPRSQGKDFKTLKVESELRPDGPFQINLRSPQGEDYVLAGVYQELTRPERLLFSIGMRNETGELERSRNVTVDFTPSEDQTLVEVLVEGYEDRTSRDEEIEGWNDCLDRLVLYFASHSATQVDDDKAEIRELIADWSDALEKKDLDRLLANYDSESLLFDAIPPYKTRGGENIRKLWEACLPYFPEKFKSEHRYLEITVDGDVAYVHGLHHFLADPPDHPCGQTWMRITVCYRRKEGKWMVAHEHVSIPFNPMTGQAFYIPNPDVVEAPDYSDCQDS
ncbi:Hypothetical protein PBC10988_5240 [Planctomycetales bacterium 10988]|nr:Hypothetical protein PBC10988_5240 [Planctomycetales bacterium 10988]